MISDTEALQEQQINHHYTQATDNLEPNGLQRYFRIDYLQNSDNPRVKEVIDESIRPLSKYKQQDPVSMDT